MNKPSKLVPGQRFQRDFSFDRFERFVVLPSGRMKIYEANVLGVGNDFDPKFLSWDQMRELDAVAAPAPADRRWIGVVERVMAKARAHLDAGRDRDFSQVYVPKEDYLALREHLADEPVVWTAIGPVTVHPVNPDGATFSD